MNSSIKKPIVVIIGTTGVGKSKFSIELAERFNGEIINADSMQMYRDIPLITNKHPINERKNIPHHVMDHIDWDEEYFIHRFEKEVIGKIEELHKINKLPIIVGGTNYYLQSVLFKNRVIRENLDDLTSKKSEISQKLSFEQKTLLINGTPKEIYDELIKIDPKISQRFHMNDTRRIRRLLEIYYKTSKLPSNIYSKQSSVEESTFRYPMIIYWLWCSQEILNLRLSKRVNEMFNNGAKEEILQLYRSFKNPSKENSVQNGVYQVIGFKEFLPWLDANREDEVLFDQGKEKMITKTVQYSKTQIKWIKKTLIKQLISNTKGENQSELKLLDATDLETWNQNVLDIGIESFEIFSNNELKEKLLIDIPINAKKILFQHNIDEGETQENNLVTHQCDVCIVKETGLPLMLVGDIQWKAHLSGKRHSSTINRIKNKEKYENWLKNKEIKKA